MNSHSRLAAILTISLGGVALLGALAAALFGYAFFDDFPDPHAFWLVERVVIGLAAIVSVISVAAGTSMLLGAAWSRPAMYVSAFLWLVVFPVGTAVSLYVFWSLVFAEQSRAAPPVHGA